MKSVWRAHFLPDFSSRARRTHESQRSQACQVVRRHGQRKQLIDFLQAAYHHLPDRPERQRAILYGTIAADLARQIRADIKTDPSVLAQDCAARLLREYHDLQQRYGARPGEVELIPDLRARFERELPERRSARVLRASEQG